MRSSQPPTNRADRQSPDLIVVGSGLVGLACAYEAALAGALVRVIDRPGAVGAASPVAAGMLAPAGEAWWGEEELLRFGLRAARDYEAFCDRLSADAESEVPYRRCGAIRVALDGDEAAELERLRRYHEQLGAPAPRLVGSECRQLEPGLATIATAGLLFEDEAEIDPRALASCLRTAGQRLGVVFESAAVSGLIVERDRVGGVLADPGPVRSGAVLLATGAWGAAGWSGSSLALPVRPVKGEVLRLAVPAGAEPPCRRIVVTERIYLVARHSGEVVIGATSGERGFETTVSAGAVRELLREAYRTIPEIGELDFIEAAAGLRPCTPDNLPMLGRAGPEGLLVALGHYRNGVLLAPLSGRCLAALLVGRSPPAEITAFDPARFATMVR